MPGAVLEMTLALEDAGVDQILLGVGGYLRTSSVCCGTSRGVLLVCIAQQLIAKRADDGLHAV